jgi:hypothetical protein
MSFGDIEDGEIRDYFERKPESQYPANIAVIRVQESGYTTLTNQGVGLGRYSIVTTRDIEEDEHFEAIASLPLVDGVAPIGRMLVPSVASTVKDLRVPAASLRADMLLIYSVDTSFKVGGESVGALAVISLGLVRNKEARVTSTVAGALVDVRTGFVYGTVEATSREEQKASVWSTQDAIESSRLIAERQAFDDFINEFSGLWGDIANSRAASLTPDDRVSNPRHRDGRSDRYYHVQFDND